jgi:hypothetical protein
VPQSFQPVGTPAALSFGNVAEELELASFETNSSHRLIARSSLRARARRLPKVFQKVSARLNIAPVGLNG